jgi:hypothetical protein
LTADPHDVQNLYAVMIVAAASVSTGPRCNPASAAGDGLQDETSDLPDSAALRAVLIALGGRCSHTLRPASV